MRKLFAVLALACVALSCLAVGALAKPAATKSSPAKLTINSFPEGVFGYLSGAKKGCLANRKVVVYQQQGDVRDPATDPKVGSDKTKLDEGAYRYSVETDKSGRLYAVAAATKGCAAAQTGSVQGMSLGAAAGPSNIPLCSPYTPEGPSEICALQRSGAEWGISYDFPSAGVRACEISKSSYSCKGNGGGPFPFGDLSGGSRGSVTMSWHPGPNGFKSVDVITGGGSGYGSSQMEARLPGPGSADLSVDKWTVPTESGGTAEFFTPNLPGQKAGEPGGPLYLNFEGGKGFASLGAEVHIKGYLYVKR
ncbi:MAG TPA: hypothetical protein VH299_02305 [Solirubrobacterales bacterium]|jgi:hypothetical protein|nr:hypothetical protein [Solirubrobacterales bacterium]